MNNEIKNHVIYRSPAFDSELAVYLDENRCSVYSKGRLIGEGKWEHRGKTLDFNWKKFGDEFGLPPQLPLLTALEHLFTHFLASDAIAVKSAQHLSLGNDLGIVARDERVTIDRSTFFQIPLLWHRQAKATLLPEVWTRSGEVKHPVRPSVDPGVIYRRHIASLGKDVSFERLDLETHLDIFHEWQNQRRVAKFWELNKPKEELRDYLQAVQDNPHHFPAILSLDGVPSGYFEIYWTAEDRLGPYYDSEPYDRGFHFLIGNKQHLGRGIFFAFLESITHFLFLEDARTRTLLAEPRADNSALLNYLDRVSYWEKRFEFDFPHKRAALLASRREDFFQRARFV